MEVVHHSGHEEQYFISMMEVDRGLGALAQKEAFFSKLLPASMIQEVIKGGY